jgi:hypothetical protein
MRRRCDAGKTPLDNIPGAMQSKPVDIRRPLLTDDAAEYDRVHWEAVVRTIIERIGVDALCEIVQAIEDERGDDFVVFIEHRRR